MRKQYTSTEDERRDQPATENRAAALSWDRVAFFSEQFQAGIGDSRVV